ncbi:MAG: Asp23/Gls24 family envelope stress response protein [Clostridiaceae bacterium]|nr:Asp23/Gls24 family envelope stress response protein [Clostridiaceae bacterium]
MNDNKMYFMLPCENGLIKVSYDVVAMLARGASMGISGVSETSSSAEKIEGWHDYKGVSISQGTEPDSCSLRLYINVTLGETIAEIAKAVQEKVKAEIEAYTSIKVSSIDVFVSGISFPKK